MRAFCSFITGVLLFVGMHGLAPAVAQSPPATNYENSGVVSEMIGSDAAGHVAYSDASVAKFSPGAQARVDVAARRLRVQLERKEIWFAATGPVAGNAGPRVAKWIGHHRGADVAAVRMLSEAIGRGDKRAARALIRSVAGLIADGVDATSLVEAVHAYNAVVESAQDVGGRAVPQILHTIHGVLTALVKAVEHTGNGVGASKRHTVPDELSLIQLPESRELRVRTPLIMPGTTIVTPTAHGARWGQVYGGVSSKPTILGRKNWSDGTITLGMGLGNPERWAGLDIALNVFDSYSDFGEERALSLKLHRRLPRDVSVALGYENVWSRVEDRSEGGRSVYGVASKKLRLLEHSRSLQRASISVGLGSDRFLSAARFQQEAVGVGLFASGAVKLLPFASLIANWTGQDLAIGLSFRPLKRVPITVTPAFTDITGRAREGARFSIGIATTYDFRR